MLRHARHFTSEPPAVYVYDHDGVAAAPSMRLSIAFRWLAVLTASAVTLVAAVQPARVIETKRHHLGLDGLSEWEEFAASTPTGPQLNVAFLADANATECTLFIRQRDVKATWNVMLNGRKLGALESLSQPLIAALRVPAGALKTGENRLTILRPPSQLLDDVVVGEIRLDPRPVAEALGEAILAVTVTDTDSGTGIPCRLTLVDREDALAPLQALGGRLATRTGVVYTGDGVARIGVAAGRYVLHAARGFEYSVATRRIEVRAGETKSLALKIRREVSTPRLIAADTHIHTLTYSKHGDATLDERMLTIAGEGIELAVATDHNHHADYAEPQARTGMNDHFRSAVGNEVTTKAGHFNAFPIAPGSSLPDARLTDWTQLLHNIRTVTGARVVTLNHPRDVHANFTPLGPAMFDPTTGELKAAPKFDCDAMEVVTSAAMQSDIMLLYRDWFALLNHGYRIGAIGASDTHDVSRFIVGQARTYVLCGAETPVSIDIDEVCASYNAGRLLVSLGLLTQMTVDDKYEVGDLAAPQGGEMRVTVDVRGPSWVTADRVELFANGVKIREEPIKPTKYPLKRRVSWTIPVPRHDVHLVAIATGPGVTAPYWEIPRPYQPSSKAFTPRVVGSTNPIWIDADRDQRFTAAREYAARSVRDASADPARLITALANYDEAVAVQAADLWARDGNSLDAPPLADALRSAPESVRAAFARVRGSREKAQ